MTLTRRAGAMEKRAFNLWLAGRCSDLVVGQLDSEPLFGLRRWVPHSVTLHAWRRFCSVAGNRWNTAQGESAATHAKIVKCGKGGAVQISGAAAQVADPRTDPLPLIYLP